MDHSHHKNENVELVKTFLWYHLNLPLQPSQIFTCSSKEFKNPPRYSDYHSSEKVLGKIYAYEHEMHCISNMGHMGCETDEDSLKVIKGIPQDKWQWSPTHTDI